MFPKKHSLTKFLKPPLCILVEESGHCKGEWIIWFKLKGWKDLEENLNDIDRSNTKWH